MRQVLLQDPAVAMISMRMAMGVSFNLAVIVHSSFSIIRMNLGLLVEVLAQTTYTCIGEDTENISLMVVELLWCWSAKSGQLLVEESLHTC